MKRLLKRFGRRTRLVFHTAPAPIHRLDPFTQALEDAFRSRRK